MGRAEYICRGSKKLGIKQRRFENFQLWELMSI